MNCIFFKVFRISVYFFYHTWCLDSYTGIFRYIITHILIQPSYFVYWISCCLHASQILLKPSHGIGLVEPFLLLFQQCVRSVTFLCYKACGRLRLKCDGTRKETRFRLSPKRMSPFKSAGASVQSTTGSRGVRISGINAGYTVFRGSVKSTGHPLHPPVSPSLPYPRVTVCHHISTGLYTEHALCPLAVES